MTRDPRLDPADETAVAAYLGGDLDAGARAAFERRVAREPALAEALYAQQEIHDLLAGRGGGRGGRRGLAAGVLLVAASLLAALLVALPRDRTRDAAPVLRGGAERGAPSPVTAAGVLDAWPEAFVWRAVPGAVRYRFLLRDDRARTVLDTVLADTALAVAAVAAADALPAAGHWRVTPVLAGDREGAAGPLVAFEVVGP